MKIKEYFSGKDVWDKIKVKGQFEWIDSTYETLFLIKFGQRDLFSSIEDLTDEVLSDLVVNRYKKKWDQLFELDVVNFLASDSVVNTTEQITDNTWVDEVSNTNQVSAFNDTELVTDDKQIQDASKNLSGTVTTTNTVDSIKLNDGLINLGILDQLEVKQMAMKDVIDLIALDLYK